MSPDEAYRLLLDVFGDRIWAWQLQDLLEGNVLEDEEIAVISGAVERRWIEGEAPAEAVQAPQIVNEENRRRYEHNKAEFHREIARCGSDAVADAAQEMFTDSGVFNAFDDACDEFKHDLRNVVLGPTRVLVRNSRARESRPRSRRRSSSSSDDDDLADLHRRCPRCGGAARPVPHSALWTCDHCADTIWEQIVQHELERVLAEAERITRSAT